MCCCFKTRRTPSIWLSVLSALVFIAGVVIAALAIQFAVGDSFFTVKTLQGDVSDVNVD
jgi:hypothetical protein